jgi:predicted nucleotidyltransferase
LARALFVQPDHSFRQLATPDTSRYASLLMNRNDIARFVAELADKFRPQKVVLFGSMAKGTASKDSDVDLLVVMPHQGSAAHQAARIRSTVSAPFPLDLIVRSPRIIQRRLKLGDSFLREILNQGEVLYESSR